MKKPVENRGGLALTIRKGEVIRIGEALVFVRKHKSGLRIFIQADRAIKVERTKIVLPDPKPPGYR